MAVATYFLSLYPYAYATGDLADWEVISSDACVFCSSVVTNVSAMHVVGHRQIESGTTMHQASGTEINPGVFYTVTIDAKQGDAVEFDATGATVDTSVGEENTLVFAVEWNGAWSIREVDVNPETP